ncbi:replicative DNA helicase [Paenibacillus cymbidii]|uniref:replicative DNA helicase n=1 Tax=Paenibacillus cymbidii TaxID=1639034 RepID=UPI00107FD8EF|nr:DnaB-like helicase C-terminal domain-containing protein [Paenibacillus cymbidii]
MDSIGVDDYKELQAERAILGAILQKPECLDDLDELEGRDFSQKRNELIFKVMRWLHQKDSPVDIVTITEHFVRRDKVADMGGVDYLMQLRESVPTLANLKTYVELVRSSAFRRRGVEVGQKIIDLPRDDYESDEEYFSAIEDIVDGLRPGNVAEMRSFSETATDYFKHLNSKAGKILSGFDQFDKWAQLWRGWLYVIAGRPSVGKTAKALQLAVGIARQRREVDMIVRDYKDAGCVLIFSQEMGENELKDRKIANLSGVSYNRIIDKGGEKGFTDDERKAIEKAYAELESLPIYIMDKPAITIDEIRSIARRFRKRHGKIAAIIVDYLQIMGIPQKKGEQRSQAIGRVTGAAKQIARKENCVFIMLSQMTRESETAEEPMLSHLKESGSIEQDADVVEFLWHDPEDVETGGKVIQSVFAKGRNIGTNKFRYLFQGWLQRYKELDKKEKKEGEWPVGKRKQNRGR